MWHAMQGRAYLKLVSQHAQLRQQSNDAACRLKKNRISRNKLRELFETIYAEGSPIHHQRISPSAPPFPHLVVFQSVFVTKSKATVMMIVNANVKPNAQLHFTFLEVIY